MDYKELINALNRYSAENQNHGGVTAQAADAITDLLARVEAAEAENAVLRRMQPVKIDGDTLELAAEVSELKNKLAEVEKARNTAISDLERIKSCAVCRHCDSLKNPIPIVCQKCHNGDKWEWRGQKEE